MAVLVLGGVAGTAMATTSDGTLITNVACSTYGSVGGCDFAVSYCATQTVLVATPSIQLQKTASPSIECSGGTVTFCIWAVNTSAMTSAFNVGLVDRLPDQMGYVNGGQTSWNGLTAGNTFFNDWGGEPFPYTRNPGEPPNGVTSSGSLYYLRFVFGLIGPGKSALVCYKAQIL